MLTKVAFYEQQSFSLFGINNSDIFYLSEKKTFQLTRYSRLEEATKQERDVTEEWRQIYWNICFFGDKIINSSSIESSNESNARAKNGAHKK